MTFLWNRHFHKKDWYSRRTTIVLNAGLSPPSSKPSNRGTWEMTKDGMANLTSSENWKLILVKNVVRSNQTSLPLLETLLYFFVFSHHKTNSVCFLLHYWFLNTGTMVPVQVLVRWYKEWEVHKPITLGYGTVRYR